MTLLAKEGRDNVVPDVDPVDDSVLVPSPMVPAPPRWWHRTGTTMMMMTMTTTTTAMTTTTAATTTTTTTTAAATTLQQPQTRDRRSVDHSPSSVREYHRDMTFSARIIRPSFPSSSSSSVSFISSRYTFSTRSLLLSLTVTRCRDSRHPSPLHSSRLLAAATLLPFDENLL